LHALSYAIDFANKTGGELILLHLVSPFPVDYVGPLWYPGDDIVKREQIVGKQCTKQLRDLLPSNSGLKCSVKHLVEFHFVPEGILDVARVCKADIIVMGVKQSSINAPRLAGHVPWAVAHEVVCRAACPVLTVRA
jgi:nucleotide-binding universal stress UspA family protein